MEQQFHDKLKWIFVVFILCSIFYVPCSIIFADSNETGINIQIISAVCNNNGICESSLGENESNCSADCGCNNNGVCESARGEDYQNCPLDCPAPTPPPPGDGYVDLTPPTVYNLLVKEITLTSALIEWDVTEYALCQLFWGETSEYKKEAILESDYTIKKHSTFLTGLFSETTYHFKIKCKDRSGNEMEIKDQKFSTLAPPDIIPPANVINFEAVAGDKKITLTWQNPLDSDFKAVKIMRSRKFYPSDPWLGEPVYNDKGISFVDTGLANRERYYYTAFTYDKAGNYSSGAIVSAIPFAPEEPPIIPPVIPPIVPPEEVPPEIQKITLKDFDFIQEGKELEIIEENLIEMESDKPLTISIDYEKVPEVLKTIMITLEKPAYLPGDSQKIEEKKYFSFLLRVNKAKTGFEAAIVPFSPGTYPLILTIFDYKNQAIKHIKGEMVIAGVEPLLVPPAKEIPWHQRYALYIYMLLVVLIAVAFIYLIQRKIAKQRYNR